MRKVLVRYKVKAEYVEENRALVKAVYAELAETSPAQFRYATFEAEDGQTFYHLASVEGEANPLGESSAFKAFQSGLKERCEQGQGPQPVDLSLLGAYGFFGE